MSVVYAAVLTGVGAYAFWHTDDLLAISYVCTTQLRPNAFSAYREYDNGTHTIDMDSCAWIKKMDPEKISEEYDELNAMYCSEVVARHDSGEPYLSYRNQRLAESQVSACAHVGLGGR